MKPFEGRDMKIRCSTFVLGDDEGLEFGGLDDDEDLNSDELDGFGGEGGDEEIDSSDDEKRFGGDEEIESEDEQGFGGEQDSGKAPKHVILWFKRD